MGIGESTAAAEAGAISARLDALLEKMRHGRGARSLRLTRIHDPAATARGFRRLVRRGTAFMRPAAPGARRDVMNARRRSSRCCSGRARLNLID